MNSSLLVPALIVVALTAGVFVFGEGLFSGGSSEVATRTPVNHSATVNEPAVVADATASAPTGSDFSWDDDATALSESPESPEGQSLESFVSTKPVTEEAPGALYGSELDGDSPVNEFASADDLAPKDFGSNDAAANLDVDQVETALKDQTASSQVEDDLRDFFNIGAKEKTADVSTARSSDFDRAKATAASPASVSPENVDSAKVNVALATSKTNDSGIGVDVFDNFGPSAYDSAPAARSSVDQDTKSVFMSDESDDPSAMSDTSKASEIAATGAGSEISGALEPVKDGRSSAAGANSEVVRKFKITNPKETTLAVTLRVDGKQLTLQPDQSYVVQKADDNVEVTFSRGGSFGYQSKTLTRGNYRFTVSREAGWKLVN